MRSLMAHQRRAMRYAQDRNSIALFMEMRLGKTLVAIRWAQRFGGHTLVVAPSSVLQVWEDELAMENTSSIQLRGTPQERLDLFDEHNYKVSWWLLNYEALLLDPCVACVYCDMWETVILDESVRIKNPKAQTTRLAHQYLTRAPHRAILTGLPNPETPLDFYEQLSFIGCPPMGFGNYWQFREAKFIQNIHDWSPKARTVIELRKEVHTNAFVLSSKDAGMGSKRVYEIRRVTLPPRIRKAYDIVECDMILGKDTTKYVLVMQIWLSQIAGGAKEGVEHDSKIKECLDLFRTELKDKQIVVWFRFNAELNKFWKKCKEVGYTIGRITGTTPLEKRAERIKRFQGGEIRFLLMQVGCGKYGLDLSAASVAIYFSPIWSHDDWAQSVKRIEHPKKKEPLLILTIVSEDTVDEDVVQALQVKKVSSRIFTSNVARRLKERRRQKNE